jgi:hypothetical protein
MSSKLQELTRLALDMVRRKRIAEGRCPCCGRKTCPEVTR